MQIRSTLGLNGTTLHKHRCYRALVSISEITCMEVKCTDYWVGNFTGLHRNVHLHYSIVCAHEILHGRCTLVFVYWHLTVCRLSPINHRGHEILSFWIKNSNSQVSMHWRPFGTQWNGLTLMSTQREHSLFVWVCMTVRNRSEWMSVTLWRLPSGRLRLSEEERLLQ